jgi:hypothetical protein
MFTDEVARQALQDVWPIVAGLAALFVFTAAVFYPLLGDRRPLVRRLGDAWRTGESDAEESRARHDG